MAYPGVGNQLFLLKFENLTTGRLRWTILVPPLWWQQRWGLPSKTSTPFGSRTFVVIVNNDLFFLKQNSNASVWIAVRQGVSVGEWTS